MAMKVLLAQDVSESGKTLLRENGFELVIAPDERPETLKRLIADCDAVFSKTCFLSEDILTAGSRLQVVAKHGIGIDNVVDLDTATRLGLYVVNTPLANMGSVAEATVGAVLALARNTVQMDHATRNDDFDAPLRIENIEVGDKTLGLIGLGNIGRLVAQKAHLGFGMRVIGYDPYVDRSRLPAYIELRQDMDDVLGEADFVSLHLNVTNSTIGLVNLEKLGLMKPNAYFLNFARGALVVEADLVTALKTGLIRGAALDVFAHEPIEKDNPLLALDNVTLSPHSSALTTGAMNRMSHDGAQGIVEILTGRKPTWCVNYETINASRQA